MNIQIERPHVEVLMARFPARANLATQLRFSDKVEMDLAHLTSDELDFLEELYRSSGPDLRSRAAQLATLRSALATEGARFEAGDLEDAFPALVRYLVTNSLRGWLFTASVATKPLPYLITRFDYVPASNDETGKILIELKANAKGTLQSSLLRIVAADLAGRTLSEILAAKGFLRETPGSSRRSTPPAILISSGEAAMARNSAPRASASTPKIRTPRIATRIGREKTSSCYRAAAAKRVSSTTKAFYRPAILPWSCPATCWDISCARPAKATVFRPRTNWRS